MRRGTTPTIQVSVDFDLNACKTVWFTLKQGKTEITKEKDSLVIDENGMGFSVTLLQDDTLKLKDNEYCEAQVRALTNEGKAIASNAVGIEVWKILKDGVIT